MLEAIFSMLSWLLLVVSILSLFGSAVFLSYLLLTERKAPHFAKSVLGLGKDNEDCSKEKPLVSVVIAARNEEQMISNCINSVLNQSYSNLEILVVDDSSTDHTTDVVRSIVVECGRVLRLISAGQKPEGWVGKSWPSWLGYRESSGEYLLFLDADSVILDSRTIELCVNYSIQNSIDIFSLSPRVIVRGIWAMSVLPVISSAINLLYPVEKVNDKKNDRAYVFGTFILARKSVYESIGGHWEVRQEIV